MIRHHDRLAAAFVWLAGLLPRASAALWRPAATCTTAALPARLQRTTARLRRWARAPKMDWY